MPVQTSVKPKIKQAAESSQASSSPCADCGATNTKYLIDTCVVTTPDEDDDAPATVARKDLCGACVVGHDVPVKRSSGEWWFGEVKDYDNTRLHPFRMSFLDGDEEWTEVTRNPSVDYLKFVGIYNDQPEEEGDEEEEEAKKSLPKKLAEAGSIGSFTDSSCSSGASSFKPGKEEHAYPLFDDSKLIHLDERSLSSFDESVFSDDEGNVEVELVQSTMTSPSKPCITPMSKQTKSGNTKKGTKDKKTRRPVMWTPEEGRQYGFCYLYLHPKDPTRYPTMRDEMVDETVEISKEKPEVNRLVVVQVVVSLLLIGLLLVVVVAIFKISKSRQDNR